MKFYKALPVLLLLPLTACQNTVNTSEEVTKDAAPNFIQDQRYITDSFLARRLMLRTVNTVINTQGLLEVELRATNTRTGFWAETVSTMTGDNPYKVDYKFTWQDEHGMTVETPLSTWRTRTIYPGETVTFHAVAPAARCRDFIFNVKESE